MVKYVVQNLANGLQNHFNMNKLIRDFFDLSKPCNFPGCQTLRDEYRKELNSSSGCTSCKKTGLINKYKSRIENRLNISSRPYG